MDCWKVLIKRHRIKLSFFLASEFSWERWLFGNACCKTYLLCLAYSATEWYQGVWICCFSSFIHTPLFFFQLYLYVRKKPQEICLKGKRPTEISVLVHVKQVVILKHKPKSLRSFCHNINPAQYFLKNSLKNDLVSYICSAWSVTFLSLVSVSDNILPYHGIVGDGVEMDL